MSPDLARRHTYDSSPSPVRYDTIEDAFYFVSSSAPGEHVAVLDRLTGEVFFASDLAGHYELPEDLDYSDHYLDIPHRLELNLAEPLVLEFARLRSPEHLDRLAAILGRPGGASRYKRFLTEKNLLEEWYLFEMDRIREALLEWLEKNDIRLESAQL